MFETVRDFLAMGGYGAFVWASYLLSAAVLAGLFLAFRRGLAQSARELEALRRSAGSRRQRPEERA